MKRGFDLLAVLALLTGVFAMTLPASAAVTGKEIIYQDGNTILKGYLAYDDSSDAPRPGVLVVHEWWGHNDYARKRAEQLAAEGYIAFALDMYGADVGGDTPDKAAALSQPFYDDRALMRQRALAGLSVLKGNPLVKQDRVAVIGYCFGGTVALELARGGTEVQGVVSFHGGLATPEPARPAHVKAQVLVLHAGDDPFVPPAERDAFVKEMTTAGVTYKLVEYPGAKHAFTNPAATENGKKFGIPVAYDAEADRQSWEEMKKFFDAVLK